MSGASDNATVVWTKNELAKGRVISVFVEPYELDDFRADWSKHDCDVEQSEFPGVFNIVARTK